MTTEQQKEIGAGSAEDCGEDEEDYGKLIYNEYMLRRRIAAEAAADTSTAQMPNEKASTASTRVRKSTRKRTHVELDEQCPDSQRKRSAKRKRESSLKSKGRGREVAKKQYRSQCSAVGCTNQVINSGVCIRHGAKVKKCSTDGCTNIAQNKGVCKRHGAKVKLCGVEGCTNSVQNGGKCKRHGAKVKLCSIGGCTNQAVNGGVCNRHGAKKKHCSSEGCTM